MSFYYVVFNFDKVNGLDKAVDFERLGINPAEFVNVKELWNGTASAPASLRISVPAKDVHIYRFERAGYSGIESAVGDGQNKLTMKVVDRTVHVTATEPISEVNVYGIDGAAINSINVDGGRTDVTLAVPAKGVAIVKTTLSSGLSETGKVMLR